MTIAPRQSLLLFLNINFCPCIRGTFPTFLSFFPLIRKVLIRERIDIVHGHQATSNLAHERSGCSERHSALLICRQVATSRCVRS